MIKAGFIGWRGLVGSVLMERMQANKDFAGLDVRFFSTSNAGGAGPAVNGGSSPLLDAHDVTALSECDVLISCQGGDYTKAIHPTLRDAGWRGYWIDAASALRMAPQSVLVLDPINAQAINHGLKQGQLDFCGANCTVSLMLMALNGLFHADQVEWVSSMTYQAASGAGAQNMRELVAQMASLGAASEPLLRSPASTALELDQCVRETLASSTFPIERFGAPLAASLLPWIDSKLDNGQSREEWKAGAEGNKILGNTTPIPLDGLCVRIGAMRCHAQAFTIKLKDALPISEIEAMLADAHEWVSVIPNEPEASRQHLTPAAVTGSLSVPVGRLRKLAMGDDYLSAFSVGDQLLWGAAEPVRRMLVILRMHLGDLNATALAGEAA